jgi:hypothetical protein
LAAAQSGVRTVPMKRLTAPALAAIFFVGASPSFAGKPITAEQAASFKIGEATEADVIHALGKPAMVTADSDGVTMIAYSSYRSHVKAITFVPVVGMFAGGARADISSVVFTFGKDGKLTKYLSSGSQTNCSSVGNCSGNTATH